MKVREKDYIDFVELDSNFKYEVTKQPGGEKIMQCFACGTCSASCPIREIDERYNPRKIIRMILLGMRQKVLTSEFIWLCANCHTCYERCPQDVRFTEIIHAVRNIALKEEKEGKIKIKSPGLIFLRAFVDSIRNYGKIWEPALLMRFFFNKRDLKGIFSYFPLGIKMFKKRKINLFPHHIRGMKEVKEIFKKVEAAEKASLCRIKEMI